MNKNEFISSGLLELYAAGIASPEEKLMTEEYLIKYPELRNELNEIELSLEEYAQANAIQPSASVKEKLFNRIATENINEKPASLLIPISGRKEVRQISGFYKFVAAAAVILLIVSSIMNYSFYDKYQHASSELQTAQLELQKQEKDNKAMVSDMNVVTDRYAMPVVLKGTPNAPNAVAKIFWMENTGEVYVDPSNLPDVASGKQYQLWAIVDGKPLDAGMISTDKGIYRIQKMKTFGSNVQAFAITLEKAGGSPTPTMDEMVVISKM